MTSLVGWVKLRSPWPWFLRIRALRNWVCSPQIGQLRNYHVIICHEYKYGRFFIIHRIMIIIVIELIWVLVDGMDIEAFRWVLSSSSQGSGYTQSVSFTFSDFLGFENLSRSSYYSGSSSWRLWLHPSRAKRVSAGWRLHRLGGPKSPEVSGSRATKFLTVGYLDGFVWELFSLCSHLNLNIS